jgi:hypothetical protein
MGQALIFLLVKGEVNISQDSLFWPNHFMFNEFGKVWKPEYFLS